MLFRFVKSMAGGRKAKNKANQEETLGKSKKSRQSPSRKEDEEDFDQMNEEGDEIDEDSGLQSGPKSSHSSRTPRGRTMMHCLSIQRTKGIKKDVTFNQHGQPIGETAKKMQSYIGVLVREKVKITYDNWKEVPNDVKDSIWEAVNVSIFHVYIMFMC